MIQDLVLAFLAALVGFLLPGYWKTKFNLRPPSDREIERARTSGLRWLLQRHAVVIPVARILLVVGLLCISVFRSTTGLVVGVVILVIGMTAYILVMQWRIISGKQSGA